MINQLKFKHGILVAILVAITMMISKCGSNNNIKVSYKDAIEYKHLVKEYTAKDGKTISYNKALKTQLSVIEDVNDSLYQYIKNLKIKNPETVTIIDTRFQLDTVFIPFDVPIEDCEFFRTFSVDSLYYSLYGSATENGVTIDSMFIPNRIGVTTGYKKTGLFKKEFIVTVTNSNPKIKTEGISSYSFEQEKWWKKGWLKFAAGAVIGGVIINKNK